MQAARDAARDRKAPTSAGVKGLHPLARHSATPDEERIRAAVAATQRVQASDSRSANCRRRKRKPRSSRSSSLSTDQSPPLSSRCTRSSGDWVADRRSQRSASTTSTAPTSAREAGFCCSDFAPEYLQEDRQRILLTHAKHPGAQSLIRLRRSDITPGQYGLDLQSGDEVVVLEALRSLSGHLALRLEAGVTQERPRSWASSSAPLAPGANGGCSKSAWSSPSTRTAVGSLTRKRTTVKR